MATPPSYTARRFEIPMDIALIVEGEGPRNRLNSIRSLLTHLNTALQVDFLGSLDLGIAVLNQDVADKVYTVEFQLVFPVPTLDEPDDNFVRFSSTTVIIPNQGNSTSAANARESAMARLTEAIDQLTTQGAPFDGIVRRINADG